jgi:hypothetical protein
MFLQAHVTGFLGEGRSSLRQRPGSQAASGSTRNAIKQAVRVEDTSREPSDAPWSTVEDHGANTVGPKRRPKVATVSQCGDSRSGGQGRTTTAATSVRCRNRAGQRDRIIAECAIRRKAPGGRRDRGDAIRSEPREVSNRRPSDWEGKRNSRGKRQDPWRKANDRDRTGPMPTLRKRSGCSRSQEHPIRVRGERAGRCVKPGLRSLTRTPAVVTPQAGSAAGPEWPAIVHAGPAQRRETDSQRHSTGEAGRQMSVIGERARGELPRPILSSGRKAGRNHR